MLYEYRGLEWPVYAFLQSIILELDYWNIALETNLKLGHDADDELCNILCTIMYPVEDMATKLPLPPQNV